MGIHEIVTVKGLSQQRELGYMPELYVLWCMYMYVYAYKYIFEGIYAVFGIILLHFV